jgi:hypothetical protein
MRGHFFKIESWAAKRQRRGASMSNGLHELPNDTWIRSVDGCGRTVQIHPHDFAKAQEMDPELWTIPGPDPNILLLTPEDYVWLWEMEIGV